MHLVFFTRNHQLSLKKIYKHHFKGSVTYQICPRGTSYGSSSGDLQTPCRTDTHFFRLCQGKSISYNKKAPKSIAVMVFFSFSMYFSIFLIHLRYLFRIFTSISSSFIPSASNNPKYFITFFGIYFLFILIIR